MGQWHRENPDYEVTGAQPPDPLEMADRRRQEERDNPPELQPCAHCGEPTTKRWCSDSCFRAEDHYEEDE